MNCPSLRVVKGIRASSSDMLLSQGISNMCDASRGQVSRDSLFFDDHTNVERTARSDSIHIYRTQQ